MLTMHEKYEITYRLTVVFLKYQLSSLLKTVNFSKFYLAWQLIFFYIVIQNICKFFTTTVTKIHFFDTSAYVI